MTDARSLWHEAPRAAAIRSTPLPPLGPGEARVRTSWSAVSRGTERLVFEGRVPPSEWTRMRAPFQEGAFSFPVKYGYCAVGAIEEGPRERLGEIVFCLHPHQDRFVAPLDMLRRVPADVPPRRATLAANMETALNGLWDSGAGPGDRIIVVGAGVLGLLVAALAARLPGAEVTVVDREPRGDIAQSLGARFASAGDFAPGGDADVVFHASASSEGLALALDAAGPEAAVVELSWHGAGAVAAPLGGAFHVRRLRLLSSQVGQVAPSRRPRWSYARRLDKALELLADPRLDALITEEIAFENAPQELPRVLAPGAGGLATLFRY
ncbi:zinc-binding alcohol dehydrogenase [Methylosinus sp. Sm6]|uniref:zinc-dependent alcohol dehydrogenase n=1 Tax=Methylosinus sp. Sm6 TaxID=2866948 RepID=UPI001C99560A|nr:zinc-binding alcohol dehydrogenase [Methylosinus sp. Sm6]MBY6240548.1 zinc-binding alcohol dehydrogenase [Methylosinus sp. Sm6]